MSSTIGSPAWITRSEASWWGEAEFGPGPDDREIGLVVAFGDEPLPDLGGDVRLRPADQAAGGDARDDPVRRVRRERQQRDLVGVLDHPQLAQDRAGEANSVAVGRRRWNASRCSAGSVSERAIRGGRSAGSPEPPDHDGVGILGLVPGTVVDGVASPGGGRGRLQARDDEERRPPGTMTSIVSRSSGIAAYPDR